MAAHLQYMPGDPRLVDQLVCELKSKGIFDQFRKDCIADVDTRPAYQNLRQRVESSVSSFLSRQVWRPDLNKNQLREKLRKHLLDGNYLEQGVERIVDQVVNPKVASVFIPQVEDLVYNYLGITRKKTVSTPETSKDKDNTENNLLPTDLEAVSPGSVKSNDDKEESMEISEDTKEEMEIELEDENKAETIVVEENSSGLPLFDKERVEVQDTQMSGASDLIIQDSDISMDKSNIPLPAEEIKLENIPAPENSPPKDTKVELENIELPREPNVSTDIPLPDEVLKVDKESFFKPMLLHSEDDDDSSSDSSLIRNMSPLTPIRNYNNENSYDAQPGFDNDSTDNKCDDKKPSSFKFTLDAKSQESTDVVNVITEKKGDQSALSYQFSNQVNLNTFNNQIYDDSSNSHNLQIDYESDVNSKTNNTFKKETDIDTNQNGNPTHEETTKDTKTEDKKCHKSSHRSRDAHRHSSSSKDRRSDSKHSSSRDKKDPKNDKKPSKDDHSKSKSSHKDRSKDRSEKKDGRDSSKHTSSSHKSSSNKDSKSRKSSSSSKHSSSSKIDDKKPSSSGHKDKSEKSSDKSSRDKSSKESKSSSHRSDKDRKRSSSSSSKSKQEEKEKEKKDKKETDDHYSVSGRGNHHRRSTDRDSNDGSSSSKGSHHPSSSKSSGSKRESKGTTSKSDNTSTSGSTSSPSDKDHVADSIVNASKDAPQTKPIVRVERHLGTPISTPPRLPFVPDITLKKPKIAANFEEAKKLMKVRKFLDEEQKRMNQEAALLLEFQANVRPCMSQAYSHIPGPEIEFACVEPREVMVVSENNSVEPLVVDMNNIGTSPATVIISDTGEHVDSIPKIVGDVTNDTFENFVSRANGQVTNETDDFEIYEQDLRTEEISTEIHEYDTTCNNGDIEEMQSDGSNDILDEVERPNSSNVENNNESKNMTDYFEVTIITEELSEDENEEKSIESESNEDLGNTTKQRHPEESRNLEYFTEQHKYEAEIEYNKFNQFYNTYSDNLTAHSKMYLMNCSKKVENMLRDESLKFGQYEIVNYHKNGYSLPPKTSKSVVRNLNVSTEVALPVESSQEVSTTSPTLSPVKLGYTFGLSPRDDTDLDQIMNNTSRREVMQIILGEVPEEMPTEMPQIDYCTESNIDVDAVTVKRKLDVDTSNCDNNNENVYSPSKLRKLSCSDQISSTTEESDQRANSKDLNNTRSKYLGKARRVGLPKPKKPAASMDPSTDRSVENQRPRPNGKLQRYDTADLYKPKLHYLSRRNHIS